MFTRVIDNLGGKNLDLHERDEQGGRHANASIQAKCNALGSHKLIERNFSIQGGREIILGATNGKET